MNMKKTSGALILVIGIIVLVLFATADIIGIGENPMFGPRQIMGTIFGAILAIIGLVLLFKKKEPVGSSQTGA